MAAAAAAHAGQDGIDAVDDAEQVDLQDGVDLLGGELGGPRLAADAGAGDQHVDRAEAVFQLADGGAGGGQVGDVGPGGGQDRAGGQRGGKGVERLAAGIDGGDPRTSAASRTASCRPIPLPAPVTRTVRSAKLLIPVARKAAVATRRQGGRLVPNLSPLYPCDTALSTGSDESTGFTGQGGGCVLGLCSRPGSLPARRAASRGAIASGGSSRANTSGRQSEGRRG